MISTTVHTIHDRNFRGHTKIGWLDSRHTFSFGNFQDLNRMGFRSLRVINDDRVIPGAGFGTHGHKDMEILTYVLAGELAHKDSLGTGAVIRPGDVQIMSAGTGIQHSEFNNSESEPVHFLQIWMLPDRSCQSIPSSFKTAWSTLQLWPIALPCMPNRFELTSIALLSWEMLIVRISTLKFHDRSTNASGFWKLIYMVQFPARSSIPRSNCKLANVGVEPISKQS
jgi:uncharacterized cupin superfamily protein